MVQQQIVAVAEVDQLAVIAGLRLEPVVSGLDEDLRFVAGAAQHPLDAEHLVADRVAVAQRGQHLVDPDQSACSRRGRSAAWPGPPAPPADPDAGGRTSRAGDRRAGTAPSFFNRSNIVEVLPLDDRPVVVLAEILAAVAAERAAQPPVPLDRLERADELAERFVEQPGVAAEALSLEHVAAAVGQHRPAERPRLERDHRQALVIRRHDQHVGRRHRVELVGVVEEAEMPDALVVGNRQQRVADQDQRQPARRILEVGAEIIRTAPCSPCSDRSGRRTPRTAREC